MAEQDKVLLMHKVDGTLRTRMFANLLEEAEAEIQEHLDEFSVKYVGGEIVETDDILTAFIEAKRAGGRSEKTLVRYRYVIERFMFAVGVKTRDVNQVHVRAYITAEQKRGIQNSTLEGIRTILNSYFNWLEHEKKISKNPLYNIETIKSEEKKPEAFSRPDIEKMKRTCTSLRDMAIINFLLATGCRVSEMTGLNIQDINFDEGECVVDGKGAKERTVFLDDVAIMTLKEYLATRSDKEEALFVGSRGERLQPGGVRIMLKRIEKASGVKNVHPHRFRRTAVTRLLGLGMPIQDVAIIVGHESIDTTMTYYAISNSRIKNSYRLRTA